MLPHHEPVLQLPAALHSVAELVVNVASKEPFDLYIGRSFAGHTDTGWSNPYPLFGNTQRARLEAIGMWWTQVASAEGFPNLAHQLAKQKLGCWCAPQLCHGHLLAAVAAGMLEQAQEFSTTMAAHAAALPRRLLVTGARDWRDESIIHAWLGSVVRHWGAHTKPVLVVGDAAGADQIARNWWASQGLPYLQLNADWDTLGSKAGSARNAALVASTADYALAFPGPKSRGTYDCVRKAKAAHIHGRIITTDSVRPM